MRGRKAYAPTDEQRRAVEMMAGVGILQDDISRAIGIDAKTLRKHFRDELDTGKARTVGRVAETLVNQALSGNTTAAIFYLKAQAGWSEKVVHAGDAENPLRMVIHGSAEDFQSKLDRIAQRAGSGGSAGAVERRGKGEA